MSAVYQESPSEVLASIVVHAVLMRGAPTGKNGGPSAPVVGTRGIQVVAAEQVQPARSGVAQRHRRLRADLALDVGVPDVHRRRDDVPLHRANRQARGAFERRIRERRRLVDHARRIRRVGDRHDQVLRAVGGVIQAIAATNGGAPVAGRRPTRSRRAARSCCSRAFVKPAGGRRAIGQIDQRRIVAALSRSACVMNS